MTSRSSGVWRGVQWSQNKKSRKSKHPKYYNQSDEFVLETNYALEVDVMMKFFLLFGTINLLVAAVLGDCFVLNTANKSLDPQPDYRPEGPLVLCKLLPDEFIECQEPIDHKGNKTAKEEAGMGCVKFGGSRYEDVEKTKVLCSVLPDIECHGCRVFAREGVPCIKYSGHYFTITLLYSILLGFLGMDRFCLGHTGTAVGKLLTLGGIGVWWVVDVILLVMNSLLPEDGSNWNPYV